MKNQNKYIEKRRHPRTNKRVNFEIVTNGSIIVAESINLSCIGAYCMVNTYIPYMTKLKIDLALPSDDEGNGVEYVQCNGVVVRVEKALSNNTGGNIHNIAIFFNEISESVKEKIGNFVKKHTGT